MGLVSIQKELKAYSKRLNSVGNSSNRKGLEDNFSRHSNTNEILSVIVCTWTRLVFSYPVDTVSIPVPFILFIIQFIFSLQNTQRGMRGMVWTRHHDLELFSFNTLNLHLHPEYYVVHVGMDLGQSGKLAKDRLTLFIPF